MKGYLERENLIITTFRSDFITFEKVDDLKNVFLHSPLVIRAGSRMKLLSPSLARAKCYVLQA